MKIGILTYIGTQSHGCCLQAYALRNLLIERNVDAEVIKVLDGADLIHAEGDVLGNAYEYLIGQFASETGKKAGEFYL